jgi:putative transposase
MYMKKTEKGTSKFTKKEKLSIIQEAKEKGVKLTLAKYDLYPGTFYYWKKKFEQIGDVGLDHGMTHERLMRIRELEKENDMLKQLLAEEQLENKLKSEMLKKKYPHLRKFLK